MGSKKKPPPAPDYTALAKQQEEAARRAIEEQTRNNRPTQITPYGRVDWTQDPTTGQWTQTESWDPRLTELFDRGLAMQGDTYTQIEELMQRGGFEAPQDLGNYDPYQMTAGQFESSMGNLPEYDKAAGDEYGRMFTDQLLARVRPQQERDKQAMETKLRMQGLVPGSEAYNRAYQNLLTSQGDVTTQAELQGQLAGAQEARNVFGTELQRYLAGSENERANYNTRLGYDQIGAATHAQNQQLNLATQQQRYDQAMKEYLLPWQTAAATQGLTKGQYNPNFQGFTNAGTYQTADLVGAAQQQYSQQMQAFNEAQASKQGKGQGIGSLVGGVAGAMFGGPMGAQLGAGLGGAAGGALFSDPALKEDLHAMSDEECFALMEKIVPHKWRWSGTQVIDMGVNAAQLAELAPELVSRGARGLMQVNYSALFAILLGAFRHLAVKETANAAAT